MEESLSFPDLRTQTPRLTENYEPAGGTGEWSPGTISSKDPGNLSRPGPLRSLEYKNRSSNHYDYNDQIPGVNSWRRYLSRDYPQREETDVKHTQPPSGRAYFRK